MGRLAAIMIGALFALMAGALGIVATLLVVLLVKDFYPRPKDLAEVHAAPQPPAAVTATPQAVPVETEGGVKSARGTSEIPLLNASYSSAPAQLLPLVLGQTTVLLGPGTKIEVTGTAATATAEPKISVKIAFPSDLDNPLKSKLVKVTAELQDPTPGIPDGDRKLEHEALASADLEKEFPLKRPGNYKVTISAKDVSEPPVVNSLTIAPPQLPSVVTQFKEVKFSTGGNSFVVTKDGLRQPPLLPVDEFQISATASLNRKVAFRVRSEADGIVRELAVAEFKGSDLPLVFPPAENPAGSPTADRLWKLLPGRHHLFFHDLVTNEVLAGGITVDIRDTAVVPPQILEISNNKHAKLQPLATSPATKVYNRYLGMRGAGLNLTQTPARDILLPLYAQLANDATRYVYVDTIRPQFTSEPNQFWSTSFKIPELASNLAAATDSGNARIFAVVQEGRRHTFSAVPANLNLSADKLNTNQIAVLEALGAGDATPTPVTDVLRTNQSSITVKAKVEAALSLDHRLVILDATGKVVATGVKAQSNDTSITARIVELTDGEQAFRLALTLGDQSGTPSSPIKVHVRSKGPRVTGVTPPNFGTAPGVQQVVIQYSPDAPLVKERAEYEANYILLGSNGTGVFNRGTEKKYRAKSALLNVAANSVALEFDPLPADLYQLRINSHKTGADPIFTAAIDGSAAITADLAKFGILDLFGNALASADGKAEMDFVLEMSRTVSPEGTELQIGLQGRIADVAGIPDSKGPPVDYPEYTKPRKYPDGFNPSDKVVSRVARLYYYRDAHRVAQIINRRTHSYNRQNSSMARQLADQARIFANSTVDDRRKAERSAVQSASKAREAENSLATLQQALATARGDLQRAQSSVSTQDESIARQNETLRALQARENELASSETATPEELQKVREERTIAEQTLAASNRDLARRQEQVTAAQSQVTLNEQRINAVLATIESLRSAELADREERDVSQAKEDRAIEQQFRLEVAAAKEDPDTYAPGIPDSDDPVTQVSLSVIGEGLIQLRGPIKGVNIVRTMINEIDVPVGQVRIGVHTVQVNGDDGNKMEHVTGRIQRCIDHSRFLTSQSAQMLRNAVVYVASEKAAVVAAQCPEGTQAARDLKYQDAFFGKDFMDELREMDSEFLHTGNKVLSLHSMDSTSLASSLFLLGLASNDTRLQILGVFEATVAEKLRKDERRYFAASDTKRFSGLTPPFKFMADNAQFVSFRGFFDNAVVGDDTLNPVQREFIRLAQIFKSRLITEIELKQRVVERALIEERVGDYQKQLKLAVLREQTAEKHLEDQRTALRREQVNVLLAMQLLNARAASFADFINAHEEQYRRIADVGSTIRTGLQLDDAAKSLANVLSPLQLRSYQTIAEAPLKPLVTELHTAIARGQSHEARTIVLKMQEELDKALVQIDPQFGPASSPDQGGFTFHTALGRAFTILVSKTTPKQPSALKRGNRDDFLVFIRGSWTESERRLHQLQQVQRSDDWDHDIAVLMKEVSVLRGQEAKLVKDDPFQLYVKTIHYEKRVADLAALLRIDLNDLAAKLDRVRQMLTAKSPSIPDAHIAWVKIRTTLMGMTRPTSALQADVDQLAKGMDSAFEKIVAADLQSRFAQEQAEAARRPLDHKKFLDLLIDETEEKFIELVEGTRAHTAVIDDYVKRLSTALDDDFSTQFYEPAFRQIRLQTYGQCQVDFGQIEHTTVLTNNRAFAKVQPQATMEFDLPKRDIVIAEALNAAHAAYSDYGALMADPNFLALTKLFSGQPTAPIFNDAGVAPLVRDVLPGLPSQTDESLLIQAPTGQPQFASQLEGLIPDPAVYKFETGTGFEIRPVIQPDGQSVVFNFNYMYTTNIREPLRADEKHLGRVKRHFINTDVQIGNYELREVSRYRVALKAARTTRGVPLLEDIPVAGILFKPLPQGESALQQNIILAQTVIYPTLFDLMGLRWAPAVADLDACQLQEQEFVYRSRMKSLKNRVYDYSSEQVDQFLRIPEGERRRDLYRTQEEIPYVHPNGYSGPGLDRQDSPLIEGSSGTVPPTAVPAPSLNPGGAVPLLPVLPPSDPAGKGADLRSGASRSEIVPASAQRIDPTINTESKSLPSQPKAPRKLPNDAGSESQRSRGNPLRLRPLLPIGPPSPAKSAHESSSVPRDADFTPAAQSPESENSTGRATLSVTPKVSKAPPAHVEFRVAGATAVEAPAVPKTLRRDEAAGKPESQYADFEAPRPSRRWLPKGWPFK